MAAQLIDNVVESVTNRGIAIGAVSRPVLRGNRACGNGDDLWVADSAQPKIDDTNQICGGEAAQ